MQTCTDTPDCAPKHAISAILRDGFAPALRAEGRAQKSLTSYLEAIDALVVSAAARVRRPTWRR